MGSVGPQFDSEHPDTIGFDISLIDFGLPSVLNGYMHLFSVSCSQCNKAVFRNKKRINEAKKFGWKTYCSYKCQSKFRNKQVKLLCFRPGCNKVFKRSPRELKKVEASFCSQSCSAKFYNVKREKIVKICADPRCKNEFSGRNKYCSLACVPVPQSSYTKKKIIKDIRAFNSKKRRIPTKKDLMKLYRPARKLFGTWNNAIKVAGFKPNPVMFAKKHIANDGHKCDSLSEKIIDDWLYARKISHKTNVPYPDNNGQTADFKVKNLYIEFFGLSGEHKRYDQLKNKKLRLIKKRKLKLIEVYPKHLFPKNKLSEALSILVN